MFSSLYFVSYISYQELVLQQFVIAELLKNSIAVTYEY